MSKVVENAEILSNRSLSSEVSELILKSPEVAGQAEPGQFVMVKNEAGNTFLRRPFGVADVDGDKLTLIYRLAGKGTKELAELKAGSFLSVEGPLGHGFKLPVDSQAHICDENGCGMRTVDAGLSLVIGGGVGIAPIIYTARKLAEAGKKPVVLLGTRNASEGFWTEYFKDFAEEIFVTTDDGSAGMKGFAIDAIPEIMKKHDIKHILVCGPTIMMEGIAKKAINDGIDCQVSLEKRMACGIGVCLGCTFEGKKSKKRWKICGDGPVFAAEEVFD